MSDDNNIFQLINNNGQVEEDIAPMYDYIVVVKDGNEHFAPGFLLFTSQHIAIMRETPKGALPILVIPLSEVKIAELVEDDEFDEIEFDA